MLKLPIALGFVLITSVGCGKVCDELESKFCTDLGPESCKIWKEDMKGIESLRAGRKADQACGSILTTSTYDTMLAAYKTSADKIKESRAKKK